MKRNSFVFDQIIMKSHKRLVKKAGGVLYLDARQKSGVKNAPLSPRTLPNGIANSPYLQRVSGDYVIQASDVESIAVWSTIDTAVCKLFTGQTVVNGGASTIGNFSVTDKSEVANSATDNVANIGKFTIGSTSGKLLFVLPKGTTLAEARTLLTGTVIRYQLATPIDTLNVPFTNPLIDLTKLGNNATLTNFAGTQTDGYTLEATVNSNGQAVAYENLVVNGDFANGVTGWNNGGSGSSISVIGGEMNATAISQYGRVVNDSYNPFLANKRYYVSANVKADSNQVALYSSDSVNYTVTASHDGSNTYKRLSLILNQPTISATARFGVRDNRASGWTQFSVDNYIIINLTDNPLIQALETQLGRQLTALECDRIFPFVSTTGVTKVSARPYLASDGVDSLAILANNPSVDITGTEDFAISWCGITPSVLTTGVIIHKGLDTTNNSQYSLIYDGNGVLYTYYNSAFVQLGTTGTIKPNTSYDIRLERVSGRLKCLLNGVLIYDQPNTTALVSQPNLRLFARSSNSGGTTHAGFFKGLTAYLILARGTYGDINKLDKALDKVSKDYR